LAHGGIKQHVSFETRSSSAPQDEEDMGCQ
jgi:hypothetical protein